MELSPTSRQVAQSVEAMVATSRMKTFPETPTPQAHCPWQTLVNQTAEVHNSSSTSQTTTILTGFRLVHANTLSLARSLRVCVAVAEGFAQDGFSDPGARIFLTTEQAAPPSLGHWVLLDIWRHGFH
jgi:hypothetical protein